MTSTLQNVLDPNVAQSPDADACLPCRLLQRTDWFTQEKAALLLTTMLVARPNRCSSVSWASI